jgi:hypothetical protein
LELAVVAHFLADNLIRVFRSDLGLNFRLILDLILIPWLLLSDFLIHLCILTIFFSALTLKGKATAL